MRWTSTTLRGGSTCSRRMSLTWSLAQVAKSVRAEYIYGHTVLAAGSSVTCSYSSFSTWKSRHLVSSRKQVRGEHLGRDGSNATIVRSSSCKLTDGSTDHCVKILRRGVANRCWRSAMRWACRRCSRARGWWDPDTTGRDMAQLV